MQNNKLSTEPYKGMRDFYPQDMAIQKYIFSKMRSVVESYGYLEYTAPLIEETDLYRAKTGEEIVSSQTYSFEDRGGRDVTIRPEMTPSIARMIARKRSELTFPLRWYSIPNLFRYEKPQRGRLREHYQLNVDIFGVESIQADIEAIQVAYNIMRSFGAQPENFNIRINDRRIINYVLSTYLDLDENIAYRVSKLIDKKEKVSAEDFKKESLALIGDKTDKLLAYLNDKSLENLPAEIKELNAASDLKSIRQTLEGLNINTVYDPTLMRGFDYYTKTVFEVFDTSPLNNRSLFGGGRYDDLVGIFGVEKVTAFGFGMGDVTIQDYLETYGLLPKDLKVAPDLYICTTGEEYLATATQTANQLRSQGINVAIDLSGRKLPAQMKSADKQSVPFVICLGENEVQTSKYSLKNMITGDEILLNLDEIANHIKS